MEFRIVSEQEIVSRLAYLVSRQESKKDLKEVLLVLRPEELPPKKVEIIKFRVGLVPIEARPTWAGLIPKLGRFGIKFRLSFFK